MKQILIALLLAFTTSTVINAQKQSSIEKDSTENVKVTLSKKTDTKADESNTTVTVIGVDTTDSYWKFLIMMSCLQRLRLIQHHFM